MKISIITVTYNSEATIRDTLNSLQSQNLRNHTLEHIIIDGLSSDSTLKIVQQCKHDALIVSESDNGIYDAMNKGIGIASGEIIGILNSDDFYCDKDVLWEVSEYFQNNKDLDILYGDLVYVSKNKIDKVVRRWRSKPYYPTFFEDANVPPHPSLFLRSNVYWMAGVFNTQFKLAADYEFMLRIFKKFNFKSKQIDRIYTTMRLGGATNKKLVNILKGNYEIAKAWEINGLRKPKYFFIKKVIKRIYQYF